MTNNTTEDIKAKKKAEKALILNKVTPYVSPKTIKDPEKKSDQKSGE